jgi:hypothetical protein
MLEAKQHRVATASPLSPVIASFYIDNYEKAALESASLKPRCWFRYDAFVIWPHGPDKLGRLPAPPIQHPPVHSVHHGNRT